MRGPRSDQSAFEHAGWIGFAPGRGDAITKDPASKGAGFLCCLVLPAGLKPLERGKNLKRLNLMNWPVADGRRKLIEEVICFNDRSFSTAVLHHHLFDVFAGNGFEGLGRQELLADLFLPLVEGRIPT